MRVGVTLPAASSLTRPEAIAELAASAEELGYASAWVSDHVLVPRSRHFPPQHQLDALATLAYLAARTERIAIGPSVLVLPYRDPIPTAKALSTIDWLSGGRLVVGVGVGWLEAEFGALGVPFAERGARTDEAMQVLRNLWETETSSFEGHWSRYQGMASFPKSAPGREGMVPMLVGGNSKRAIDRAARLGDGWHPLGLAPAKLAEGIAAYKTACEEHGRPPGRAVARYVPGQSGPLLTGTPQQQAADLHAFAEARVDELMLSWEATELDSQLEHWRNFAQYTGQYTRP